MSNKANKSSLLRLYKFLGKRRFSYFIGLLGSSCMMLAFNYIMSIGLKGVTSAILNKDFNILINSITFTIVSMLILVLILPILSYLFESSVKKTTGDIRKHLFEHIQKLPIKHIENSHSGDFISRLTNDIQTAENAYSNQLLMLLMSLVSGIGGTIIVIFIDWKLAIIALILGILSIYVNTKFVKPIKKYSDKIQKLISKINQTLTDTLGGIQVIRMFNLDKIMDIKFKENCNDTKKSAIELVIKNSFLNSLNGFLGTMSFFGIMVIGSIEVAINQLSFNELMQFIQMCNCVMWMFNSIGNFLTQLQTSLAGADRIFDILDLPVEEENTNDTITTTNIDNELVVSFNNVKFSYEDNKAILKGIDLNLLKNQVLALVGSSGCGKSTVFKLLLKFYNFNSGNIKIAGKNIQEYSPKELRRLISYVSQDNYLFSGTIADNIGYGKENSTIEEIIKASKSAYAHDFIMEFPNAYDTEVGERGAHLSGGQRQRIAIARAILKDAPILLLDEATSSLDSESEKAVQDALEILMQNRSTMIIAHRLSTIQNADNILVLEDGNVVEEGTHEKLLAFDKTYATLYNMQFKNMA